MLCGFSPSVNVASFSRITDFVADSPCSVVKPQLSLPFHRFGHVSVALTR